MPMEDTLNALWRRQNLMHCLVTKASYRLVQMVRSHLCVCAICLCLCKPHVYRCMVLSIHRDIEIEKESVVKYKVLYYLEGGTMHILIHFLIFLSEHTILKNRVVVF